MLTLVSTGDRRACLFRDGDLSQLTEDHSEIWTLCKASCLTKEELRTHPRGNVLSKALVVSETITADDFIIII